MLLEKRNTYNAPEGKHRAMIIDASIQRNKEGQEELKIIFELLSATHPLRTYMARRCFKPNESEELGDVLLDLVGDDIGNIVGPNRQICSDGLQMLRWKECDIEIEHYISPKHENPFCLVTRITAPGKLVKFPKEVTE